MTGSLSAHAAINVKDRGANGNGRSDDTAAIQAAINAVDKGGTVFVPKGVYMVDALKSVRLKSDMSFKLAEGAVLQVIPNEAAGYALLQIEGRRNVSVLGGLLQGDRDQHKGKTGEWGFGIYVGGNSERVSVKDTVARDMWGDGFYVGGARSVTLENVIGDRNRRQGLSVVEVQGLVVRGSSFTNTFGTRPAAGIDIEPDQGNSVHDVKIYDCSFKDNDGAGIKIAGKRGTVARVTVACCRYDGNQPLKVGGVPNAKKYNLIVLKALAYFGFFKYHPTNLEL